MAAIHLDANYLICSGEPGHPAQPQIQSWRANGDTFAVSAIAWSEFVCGPLSSDLRGSWELLLGGAILPMDRALAEHAADLFNETGRRSRSLQDCIIAATAIREKAPLATFNRDHFERFVPFGLIFA